MAVGADGAGHFPAGEGALPGWKAALPFDTEGPLILQWEARRYDVVNARKLRAGEESICWQAALRRRGGGCGLTGAHGLAALRQAMTDYLTAQGVESMTAWPKGPGGGADGAPGGGAGEGGRGRQRRVSELSGAAVRRGDQELDGGVWAEGEREISGDAVQPRRDGERGCRALLDRWQMQFLRGGPEGFALEKWSVGETGFDRESGSFRGKIQAVCRGMLTAVTSESGALVGFRVKGEVRTWNE